MRNLFYLFFALFVPPKIMPQLRHIIEYYTIVGGIKSMKAYKDINRICKWIGNGGALAPIFPLCYNDIVANIISKWQFVPEKWLK